MSNAYVQNLKQPARVVLNRVRELSVYAFACGARPRPSQERFLVLAGARRGSHLLIDLLNNHPEIHCDGEIFGRRLACRLISPDLFIRGQIVRRREARYGFKVSIGHLVNFQRLDPRNFLSAMHHRGWRIVHLVRHNVLRVCISSLLAHQRRQWHATKDNPVSPGTVTVDCDELRRQLDLRSRTLRTERECLAGLPVHQVVYERDLADTFQHQPTLDRAFDFLGLPPRVVKTSLVRTSSLDISEMVDNYDEVVRSLQATPYADLLDKARSA